MSRVTCCSPRAPPQPAFESFRSHPAFFPSNQVCSKIKKEFLKNKNKKRLWQRHTTLYLISVASNINFGFHFK